MEKDINKLNTVEEIEKYRASINEACDKRAEEIRILNNALSLSDKSFGYLKECFECMSPKLFENENGRSVIHKYIKTIKESEILSKLHKIYETIRRTDKNADVDFLVNSIISENIVLKHKNVLSESKKLGMVVAEGYVLIGKDADSMLPENNDKFYNSVAFITENKKSLNTLNGLSNSVKCIKEEISKHEELLTDDSNFDENIEKMVSEFNEKYENELSEEEKKIIRDLSSEGFEKENVFNKYKNECVEKIKEATENFIKNGDNESAKKLNTIFEQVSKKYFVEDTLEDDLSKFIELSSIL